MNAQLIRSVVKLVSAALLSSAALLAQASELHWHSVRASRASTPGLSLVTFRGSAGPDTAIAIDPKKVIVIQHHSSLAQFELPISLDQFMAAYQRDLARGHQGIFGIKKGCYLHNQPVQASASIKPVASNFVWMKQTDKDWYTVELTSKEMKFVPSSCVVSKNVKINSSNLAAARNVNGSTQLAVLLPSAMVQLPITASTPGGKPKSSLYNLYVYGTRVESNVTLAPAPILARRSEVPRKVARTSRAAPPGPAASSDNPTASRIIAEETQPLVEAEKPLRSYHLDVALGISRHSFSQGINTETFKFERSVLPSYQVGAMFKYARYLASLSYANAPSIIGAVSPYSLQNNKYNWGTIELALGYQLTEDFRGFGVTTKLVTQRRALPFLSLGADNTIDLFDLGSVNMGPQVELRYPLRRLQITGTLGLFQPLDVGVSDVSSGDFKSTLVYRLGLGADYQLLARLALGLHLHYNAQSVDYTATRDSLVRSGTVKYNDMPILLKASSSF